MGEKLGGIYKKGPVRDGLTYCAPWCGAGCTYAAFKRATERADTLARRLGPSWEPVVHENMGWHYKVVSPCGCMQVNEYWPYGKRTGIVDRIAALIPTSYTVFLNTHGKFGGRWTADADTPEEAIREVLAVATAEHDAIDAMLKGARSLVDGLKP